MLAALCILLISEAQKFRRFATGPSVTRMRPLLTNVRWTRRAMAVGSAPPYHPLLLLSSGSCSRNEARFWPVPEAARGGQHKKMVA